VSKRHQDQIETSFPVLFLSNTHDPVTPLIAAVKMASKFKDAGLLEQKAQGHCTLSAVSLCTAKIVRDYVREGMVPPPPKFDGDDYLGGEWTQCDADEQPWQALKRSEMGSFCAAEQQELLALKTIQDTLDSMPRWRHVPLLKKIVDGEILAFGWTTQNQFM
jgi:hypothetical protein